MKKPPSASPANALLVKQRKALLLSLKSGRRTGFNLWLLRYAIAEKHYRRRPLDLLRLWHSRIEAFMLEQAGIPQPEEAAEGLRLVKAR